MWDSNNSKNIIEMTGTDICKFIIRVWSEGKTSYSEHHIDNFLDDQQSIKYWNQMLLIPQAK